MSTDVFDTIRYNQVVLGCDNEPSFLHIQRVVVQAGQAVGLETAACTPAGYQHASSPAETGIRRTRALAGNLAHSWQQKLIFVIDSAHVFWNLSVKHSVWFLHRYNSNQGLASFEVVLGKGYTSQIYEIGKPVLGYARTARKGNSHWQKIIVLGKAEGQDTYLLCSGNCLILNKSVRRVKTDWISHMVLYSQFKFRSWQYEVGVGGRIVPTKRRVNLVALLSFLQQVTFSSEAWWIRMQEAVK